MTAYSPTRADWVPVWKAIERRAEATGSVSVSVTPHPGWWRTILLRDRSQPEFTLALTIRDDLGDLADMDVTTPACPDPRNLLGRVVRPDAALRLVTAWLGAEDQTPTPAGRMTRFAATNNLIGGSDARTVFSRTGPVQVPTHADGRYEVAGYVEPYPGAWPTIPLILAQRGDLSALWPYLDAAGPR